MAQVDADKATDRDAVVDGILDPFVGEAKALLGDVHAQHALKPQRWTATAALRVVRLQRGDQLNPWRDTLIIIKKPFAAGALLLLGKLGIGKADLHRSGLADGWVGLLSHRSAGYRPVGTIKSVVP